MIKETQNAEETQAFAADFHREHPNVAYCLLYGELGAGKTTFVKGFAKALGIDPTTVKSPTFSLIEDHGAFVHADLYRLAAPDPHLEAQLEEYSAAGKTVLIEWPERLSKRPEGALTLHFTHQGEDARTIELNRPPSALC